MSTKEERLAEMIEFVKKNYVQEYTEAIAKVADGCLSPKDVTKLSEGLELLLESIKSLGVHEKLFADVVNIYETPEYQKSLKLSEILKNNPDLRIKFGTYLAEQRRKLKIPVAMMAAAVHRSTPSLFRFEQGNVVNPEIIIYFIKAFERCGSKFEPETIDKRFKTD